MHVIKNVIFYNHWHKGDIFLSRSFIKDIINKLNLKLNFYYIHNNGVGFFNDLKINCDIDPDELKKINEYSCPIISDDSILFNTWYKSCHDKHMTGCNIQTFYSIFKSYYEILNIKIEDVCEYIPVIDFDKFNINLNLNHNTKSVLFCNNTPLSGQSNTRNMDIILDVLAKKYNDLIFYVTNDTEVKQNNIIQTKTILQNNNLFEISKLSTFCNFIIGRSSGPYSFCLTKENILNDNIKYVSICTDSSLVDFGLTKYCIKNKFNFISSDISDENIIKEISLILN